MHFKYKDAKSLRVKDRKISTVLTLIKKTWIGHIYIKPRKVQNFIIEVSIIKRDFNPSLDNLSTN